MANKNTNFRLGLDRQQLIEAAKYFGKADKSARKSNTKRLEQFITSKLGGKGMKVPNLSEQQRRDIRDSANTFGLTEGLQMVSTRIRKVTGTHNENNFLRLTVGNAISAYTDNQVTSNDITEVISRLPNADRSEIISGVISHEPYYQNVILDYLEEIEQNEEQ